MAGRDREIDPLTKDYVDDGAGGYENTTTVRTAGYHQLTTERDQWWADRNVGSDLHLAPQLTASATALQFIEDSVRAALQALIDAGLAREQNVIVQPDKRIPDRMLVLADLLDQNSTIVDLTEVTGTNTPGS